VNNRLDKPLSG